MKIKTTEAEGDTLDYLVWCAERGEQPRCSVAEWAASNDDGYHPSSIWAQGGPILEKMRIGLCPRVYGDWLGGDLYCWGELGETEIQVHGSQDTRPLVAGMRAYAIKVFGYEVELP